MRRVQLLFALSSAFALSVAFADAGQQLQGRVYSPEQGIICDKSSGFCADGFGISLAFTKVYLGQRAEDLMMERIREAGAEGFDTVVYRLSNGVRCDSAKRQCFSGKDADVVDEAHTAALFGE